MKLLSRSDYDSRLSELNTEKQQGEADHRRACLALEIGSGSEADVQKAKDHLEKVEGRISGLHSAWQESQRLAAVAADEERRSAHESLMHEVDVLLQVRKGAMMLVEAAAAQLASGMRSFDAMSATLRQKYMAARRTANSDGICVVIESALSAGAVAGQALKDNGADAGAIFVGDGPGYANLHQREEKFALNISRHFSFLADDTGIPSAVQIERQRLLAESRMPVYAPGAAPPSGFDAQEKSE